MRLFNFFDEIYTPRFKIPKDNREELVRITLRKLIIYLWFLVIASIVILTMRPNLLYTFTKVLKAQFTEQDFEVDDNDDITFEDIRTVKDVWKFLEEVIIENIYNENWYSDFDPISPTSADDNKVLFENSLLGVPRLRQLRVRNDSCIIHENFRNTFSTCYDHYSKNSEDTQSFGLETETAWIYHRPETLRGILYFGLVAIYDSGGFYQDLALDKNSSLEIINELFENFWITRNTRVVFLDFTLYNGNMNLFCIIKFVFELPPTGGVLPSASFHPLKLLRYTYPSDYFILGCEFAYMSFIIFFTINGVRDILHYRWAYFKYFWNYINFTISIGSFLVFGFSIYRNFFVENQIAALHQDPNKYTSFESVGYWQTQFDNVSAILLFIFWFKIFQFINLSRTMGQLSATLSRCSVDILGFSLMFFIVFFAFAQMGYLVFGSQIEKFSTFGKSLMTLLMTILGDFDYYEIERHNKILAPIFFTTYIFLVFFVLFNMFLAIITDTYSDIKDDIKTKKSELEIIDFVGRAPKKLYKKIKKILPEDRNELKLAGNDLIEKIRKLLELCNFTDLEIKVFFSMYNIDENEKNDEEDIKKLITDIKNAGKDKNYQQQGASTGQGNITINSFMKQQKRLDTMNEYIQNLSRKVDNLNSPTI